MMPCWPAAHGSPPGSITGRRYIIFPTPFYAQYWGTFHWRSKDSLSPTRSSTSWTYPERLSDVGKRVFSSLQENEGFKVVFDKEGSRASQREAQTAVAAPESGAGAASAVGVPAYN